MRIDVELPDMVRRRALAYGAVGEQWLRDLPAVVEELATRWELRMGATLSGGTAAYVAEATTAAGAAAVLKVAMPAAIDGDGAFARTVEVYELTRGRGCARLLGHDRARSALLLERLGANLSSLGLPTAQQLEIIAATVQQVWRPVPAGALLRTGAEKARWLADFIATTWESLGRPCSAKAVDLALAYAARRVHGFDPATAVLVHGDAHGLNTLQSHDGFKLVDPEGLVSEPAHDLGIPMREFNDELLAGDALGLGLERAHFLGRITGQDPSAIWQWGFVERVSTGLYAMTIGHDATRDFLAVADRWADV